MSTEGEVEERGRKSARASDWVWALYPAVVFGLSALAVAWKFPGGDIEHTRSFFDVSHADLFITRWFLCFPIFMMSPYLALRFVRTGGLERLREPGEERPAGGPWWTMTRQALLCHGTLLAFLLGGLAIATWRGRQWWEGNLPPAPLVKAGVFGVFQILTGVGLILPNCLFTFSMHRDGERRFFFCGLIFTIAWVVILFLSTVSVWSSGPPYGWTAPLIHSPVILFVALLSAANLPLLLVVPRQKGESLDGIGEGPAVTDSMPDLCHENLAIAYMGVFFLLYTGLFVYVEWFPRSRLGDSTLLGLTVSPIRDFYRFLHPALVFCAILFFIFGYAVGCRYYPHTLGKPGGLLDRTMALSWVTVTVLFLVAAYGSIVYPAVRFSYMIEELGLPG